MGTPSYEGKQVYMGLDEHREFFVASCICDEVKREKHSSCSTPEPLISVSEEPTAVGPLIGDCAHEDREESFKKI